MKSFLILLYSLLQLAEKRAPSQTWRIFFFFSSYTEYIPWGWRRLQPTFIVKSGELAPATNEKKYHSRVLLAMVQAKHKVFLAGVLNEKQCLSWSSGFSFHFWACTHLYITFLSVSGLSRLKHLITGPHRNHFFEVFFS